MITIVKQKIKIIFIFFFFAFFTLSLIIKTRNFPSYRDEEVYINCGVSYILNATPPLLCNFEHPPLGKYIIGFAEIYGFSRIFYLLLYYASTLIVFLVVLKLTSSYVASLLASLLLYFDTIFYNTHRYLLLDPLAVFFTLLAVYTYLTRHYYISAVVAGLAVASKFSSLPVILAIFLLTWRSSGFKRAVVYAVIALLVYLLTFTSDLQLGWDAIIRHHVEIYRYLSWRHGFSIPIAVNGFLKLIVKLELWRYIGEVQVYVDTVARSVVNQTFIPIGKSLLVINIGAGSIVWYALLPLLLYATYRALVKPGEIALQVLVLFSWFSLVNILAGPIDWYYVNCLPYLYMTMSTLLQRTLSVNTLKTTTWILVTIGVGIYYLVVLGLIPFRLIVLY